MADFLCLKGSNFHMSLSTFELRLVAEAKVTQMTNGVIDIVSDITVFIGKKFTGSTMRFNHALFLRSVSGSGTV